MFKLIGIAAIALSFLVTAPAASAQETGGLMVCDLHGGAGCYMFYGDVWGRAGCDIFPVTGPISGPFTCRSVYLSSYVTTTTTYRNVRCTVEAGWPEWWLAYDSYNALIVAKPSGTTVFCPRVRT